MASSKSSQSQVSGTCTIAELLLYIAACLRFRSAFRSYYCQACSRFLPLVRDEKAWKTLYDEEISHPDYPTAGTLVAYASRGWCRLEIVAGLAPKRFASRAWRPGANSWCPGLSTCLRPPDDSLCRPAGPRNLRFRFHHNPARSASSFDTRPPKNDESVSISTYPHLHCKVLESDH